MSPLPEVVGLRDKPGGSLALNSPPDIRSDVGVNGYLAASLRTRRVLFVRSGQKNLRRGVAAEGIGPLGVAARGAAVSRRGAGKCAELFWSAGMDLGESGSGFPVVGNWIPAIENRELQNANCKVGMGGSGVSFQYPLVFQKWNESRVVWEAIE
jgi:hypothetical protein